MSTSSIPNAVFADITVARSIVTRLFIDTNVDRQPLPDLDRIPDLVEVWPRFAVWLLVDSRDGIINYLTDSSALQATRRVADLYMRWRTVTKDQWRDAANGAYRATQPVASAGYAADAAISSYDYGSYIVGAAASATTYSDLSVADERRKQFNKLCELCAPRKMTIDIPQYSEPKSGRTSVSSFSNEKSRYAARPCKCKHAREIHSSLKGRTLQQSIWTKCNFPACECTQYSPTALISFKGVHQHGTDCKWDCDEAIVMLATSLLRKIQQRPVDSASSYNDTRINELKVQLEKLIPEVDPDANIEVRKFKLKRAP